MDQFFDSERTFLLEYHGHLKEATNRSDRMTSTHKVQVWIFMLVMCRFFGGFIRYVTSIFQSPTNNVPFHHYVYPVFISSIITFQSLADNYIKLSSALIDLAALESGTPSTTGTTNGNTGNVK